MNIDNYFKDLNQIYNIYLLDMREGKNFKYSDLIGQVLALLLLRLKAYYEELILKNDNIDIKNIIKSNIEYKDELRNIKEYYINNSYLSVDKQVIDQINNILKNKSYNFIYNFKYIDYVEEYRSQILKFLEQKIKSKNIKINSVNTVYDNIIDFKTKSKLENKEDTIKTIKTYYSILNNRNITAIIYNYLEHSITNENINYLLNFMTKKELIDTIKILISNKEEFELLFLSYIVTYDVYNIKQEHLEDIFLEEQVEDTYYDTYEETCQNIDNMYLKNSFKYAQILKKE